MDLVQCFTILFVLYITGVDSLMFYLEPMAKKCLKEEIHKDVLVTGDYDLTEQSDQKTNLIVTDTRSEAGTGVILQNRLSRLISTLRISGVLIRLHVALSVCTKLCLC